MDPSGGEVAAMRSSSGAGEDRISALPDDLLVLILLRLDTAADAGRTGVLSRRWRRVWKHLPELRFPADAGPQRIRAALSAHEANLRRLSVGAVGATPGSVAAWLAVAAHRVSGSLTFRNQATEFADFDVEVEENGAFELPCFDRATILSLDLGFLGLAVPPAGVFARLTSLVLQGVRFRRPCDLGDAVSWPRCPLLENLSVHNADGLLSLAIQSESLVRVCLANLCGFRQLTVVAPALEMITVKGCFRGRKSVANISAPQLELLEWQDTYDLSSVQLGEMVQLQGLVPDCFWVYTPHHPSRNDHVARLLKRIQITCELRMVLLYPQDISGCQYLMEGLMVLPRLTALKLMIANYGHSFGASLFHMLRMCIDLKELVLHVKPDFSDMEALSLCPPGCVCGEPSNWKTEELTLNSLEEIEIHGMKGTDHEVTSLKQLFNWARVLKIMRVTFGYSITERRARELRQMLSSFSSLETRMEFYMYQYHNVSN